MQVILQGSLRHFPPSELLVFLTARGQSGTLDLETTGKKTRIIFDNDRIVWAESNREGEPADVIVDTFEWTAGTFTLLDSAVLPEGAKAVSLDVAPLLQEAKRRVDEAGLYDEATVFRVIENPAAQVQVSLNIDQLRLLFRLTDGKTFRELVAEVGIPKRDLADRLRELGTLGLITITLEEITEVPAKAKTPQPKRRITQVGSLTPDNAPDNVYPLLDAEHTIGRGPANSITIADGSVSTNHARILKTAEGFVVEDMSSRNGTFVNGERVTEKRLLVDGDLIRLGKVIMTFNLAKDSVPGETTQPEIRVS